jgi:hypothetical protein
MVLGFQTLTRYPYHLFQRKVTGEAGKMVFFESDDEAVYVGSALTIKGVMSMIPADELLTSRYIIVSAPIRIWEPV